ncbi:MAG: ATP-binding protein [Bacteroidales bacterium]
MISLNQKGIDHIFNFRIKESINVEYLGAREVEVCNEKRALFFSQLISAMANANGGVIFIGIHATRKIPRSLQALTDETVLEWLETVCATHIYPHISNVVIQKIEVSEDGRFCVGISVPDSHKAPHMAEDKRFYKRVGIKTESMEEYEIRDLYTKSKRSEIEVYAILNTGGIPHMENGKFARINFYPKFLVKNVSSAVEKFYKVEIAIPSHIHNPNFDALQDYFSRFEDGYTVFSIPQKNPLFQHEIATVAEAHFVVDARSYEAFAYGELLVTVFYSNGIETRNFSLKETFLYKKVKIEKEDFTVEQSIIDDTSHNTPQLF